MLCVHGGGGGSEEPGALPVLRGGLFAVLTWGGELSAVSQDAIRDAAWARSETVIDEWDEEFDRGKVSTGCAPGGGGGLQDPPPTPSPDPRAFLPLHR